MAKYKIIKGQIVPASDSDVGAKDIIFCKDCRFADEWNHCSRVKFWTTAMDFCSRGERRGKKY